MREYKVIKGYRSDPALRRSFNALAGRTFGLDFEGWYRNGYWTDKYNPYSIVIDGEIAANVSVNWTDFLWNNQKKHFIQLGTVMTEERYQNQGLIRRIMEEIDRDYSGVTDGVYLFANGEVLDFYPKFGFRREEEVLHTAKVFAHSKKSGACMEKVHMKDKRDWDRLEEAIRKSRFGSAFSLTDNSGLPMFYLTQFMKDNVYYCRELQVYAVARAEEGELLLYDVFSENCFDLHSVIGAFGREIRQVHLGFTPADRSGFEAGIVQEEDTFLFVRGEGLDDFASWGVRFPLLAHA
ncbi:MAG: GNAT family N-acetyltransferase [Acetatifactor sp.]|nr:GNAT family N-acetyltransferase [Acetatifactor sp.]